MVAKYWGRSLSTDNHVIVTEYEHHSNLVPWQMLSEERGIQIEVIPVLDDRTLDQGVYRDILTREPKLVAIGGMSNVLGTVPPVAEMIRAAHDAGALVLVDGAQTVPHQPVDVRALDADFLAFSAHKMLGPTGIGILYEKEALLQTTH